MTTKKIGRPQISDIRRKVTLSLTKEVDAWLVDASNDFGGKIATVIRKIIETQYELERGRLKMNYGQVVFEGVTYQLTSDMDFTGRQLPNRTNYNDAAEGQTYEVEMSAYAMLDNGQKVTLYWIYEWIKGAEPDLDVLNMDDVNRIELERE